MVSRSTHYLFSITFITLRLPTRFVHIGSISVITLRQFQNRKRDNLFHDYYKSDTKKHLLKKGNEEKALANRFAINKQISMITELIIDHWSLRIQRSIAT